MKHRQLSLPWSALTFLIVTLLILGCSGKDNENQDATGLPVKVAAPLSRSIQIKSSFTGRFQPVEQFDVKARVSGYIVKANFAEGNLVTKGTPLFYIDRRPFQITLDAALGNLARQKAAIEERESNFSMVNGLRETGAISAEEYERRRLAVQSSKAELQGAEAAVAEARLNLEFSTVRAPITGRVGRKLVTEGNLVSGGNESATLLTTIVQTQPIHFYVSASEKDFTKLLGASRERKDILDDSISIVIGETTGKAIFGKIDFLGNQFERGTGSLEIRAVVDNKNERIQPGMFGEAVLFGREIQNALLVPEVVIGSNQNIKYVYTVDGNNQVQMKPIQIGELYGGNMRWVVSGITSDDKVIINNIQKVRPGMPVSPIEALMNNQNTAAQ